MQFCLSVISPIRICFPRHASLRIRFTCDRCLRLHDWCTYTVHGFSMSSHSWGIFQKKTIFTAHAGISSCSLIHLYAIIKVGLCNWMWFCGYCPPSWVAYSPRTQSSLETSGESEREQIWNDTFSFGKPNVIIVSLSPRFEHIWLMWWAGRASKNTEWRHLSSCGLKSCNSACLEILDAARCKERKGRRRKKNVDGDCITKLAYWGVCCFDGFTFGW